MAGAPTLDPYEYLILAKPDVNHFVQFAVHEEGAIRAEAVANQFAIEWAGGLTVEDYKGLDRLGWKRPRPSAGRVGQLLHRQPAAREYCGTGGQSRAHAAADLRRAHGGRPGVPQLCPGRHPDPIPKPGAPTGIAASAPMEVRSGWHLSPGLGWPLPRTRAGNRCKCRPPRNSTIGPRKSGRSNPSSPPGPRSSYSSARAWVWAPRPTYSALSWASIRTRRNGPASR